MKATSKIRLNGNKWTGDARLDRLVQFDERSRNFPIRALIGPKKPRSYTWRCDVWLNQGNEGACTGFSVAHEGAARPVVLKTSNEIARSIYQRAKQLDQWEGEDYEGSSVLAAVKAAQERGWYAEYRWAFGLLDLQLALGYAGPVILGIPWYEGMMGTDTQGFIRPTGAIVGGHAILANAISIKKGCVKLHNSWGMEWGIKGECFITFRDLEVLLAQNGEACIPVKRTLGS